MRTFAHSKAAPLQFQQAFTRFKAGFLTLIFLASWAVKVGHMIFQHHAHRSVPVCEAARQGQTTHLHDARYQPDDCSICAFLFAIPELIPISALPVLAAAAANCCVPAPPAILLATAADSVSSRGPPVLCA